jgi:hypothetical protein
MCWSRYDGGRKQDADGDGAACGETDDADLH